MPKTILPAESQIYRCFVDLVGNADRVFIAGLPGVGKSLLLQQLTLMALEAGRQVHLLQWDTARQPFETPRYPLDQGATHPMVIKATGAWLREALLEWDNLYSTTNAILIGEVPLVGGRFMEIVRPTDDGAESLLADKGTQFVLPVPSRQVRALIETRRGESIANPTHKNEAQDASPELLRALWQDLFHIAVHLGYAEPVSNGAPYSPEIYEAVYRHLLRHRQVNVLAIDEPLRPAASVYDFDSEHPQVIAKRDRAQAVLREIEATTSEARVKRDAASWYQL